MNLGAVVVDGEVGGDARGQGGRDGKERLQREASHGDARLLRDDAAKRATAVRQSLVAPWRVCSRLRGHGCAPWPERGDGIGARFKGEAFWPPPRPPSDHHHDEPTAVPRWSHAVAPLPGDPWSNPRARHGPCCHPAATLPVVPSCCRPWVKVSCMCTRALQYHCPNDPR